MASSLTLCVCLLALTSSLAAMKVVDMTFDLGDDTIYWPGNPAFNFTIIARGKQRAGYWYESNSFFTPEHGGTHVDAPAHFHENSWRVEQIPASHLVGPAVVVDVKSKAAADPDYLLTVADLQAWEKTHGKIPPKSVVIMNSGWGSRYPNASRVFNTANPTNATTFHFPGIHPDAASFLATQRQVIAVGVDTPSTDYGQSVTFATHVTLGQHNVLGLENLANLDELPSLGATLVIGLIKLRDGSGGPARILGIVEDIGTGTGSGRSAFVGAWIYGIVPLCYLLVVGR